MDDFEDRYFKLNRKLMSFIGLWYTQPYRKRMLRYIIISFSLFFRLVGQTCQLFTINFDVRSIVSVLQSFIPGVLFTTLYYMSILHCVSVLKILSYIKEDWQQVKNNVELKIMRKHAHETKVFTTTCGCTWEMTPYLIFYVYNCFFIIPLLLSKILSSNEVMKNTDRYPLFSCYNYLLNTNTYYYPTIIYQTVLLILSAGIGVASYSSYFWFIQHTCARLSIIKTEIHRPFVNSNAKDIVPAIPADLSHWMIGIIQKLRRTAEFMNLLNTVTEQSYLLQILLAFFFLVINFLCLFQIPIILEHKEDEKDILAFVVLIVASTFPIYVNCHLGQKLIDYSVEVYKEACMIPIHEISLKTQKLLLIVLMLTAKPYTITIGKFFVSSHEIFSDLIRMSLSFSMMLRSMQRS